MHKVTANTVRLSPPRPQIRGWTPYHIVQKSSIFLLTEPYWGHGINTWADIINRANLGMEVMHERNAHNFPLDLAAGEATPVALTAPAING